LKDFDARKGRKRESEDDWDLRGNLSCSLMGNSFDEGDEKKFLMERRDTSTSLPK
jgi:hypothetical protein